MLCTKYDGRFRTTNKTKIIFVHIFTCTFYIVHVKIRNSEFNLYKIFSEFNLLSFDIEL